MDNKPIWQSKTAWIAVIAAVAAFFPGVQGWIVSNPLMYAEIVSGVVIALRFLSKGSISIN